MTSSVDDVRSPSLWGALFAEALGVFLLVLVGCGACLPESATSNPPNIHIALAFGFGVATVIACIASVSGGHVNPAVTMGRCNSMLLNNL